MIHSEDRAAMDSSNELPKQIGDYAVEREIGRGNMGIVYAARKTKDHPLVRLKDQPVIALKVMDPRWSQDALLCERFRREGAIGMRLHHANIARVHHSGAFDFGDGDKRFCLVMDYVDGVQLSDMLVDSVEMLPLLAAL